jgi:hypothetical protein
MVRTGNSLPVPVGQEGSFGLRAMENNQHLWRKVLCGEGHAYFVTFSCAKRRRLLDDDQAKGVVIHYRAVQLANQQGSCLGFVVMPEHVHALVWFHEEGRLSPIDDPKKMIINTIEK